MPDPPDEAPVPTRPQQSATTFPCRMCGAQVHYLPGTLSLRCPYCGADQEVPAGGGDGVVDEHPYEQWLTSADKPKGYTGGHIVTCPRCAATVAADDLSLACPFCDAPIVVAVDPAEQVVPEGIVPFRLTKDEATQAMRGWARSRWFAPGSLKKITNAERINGTYVPHWTYDARTDTRYTGLRGDHYYTTQTYTDGEGKTRTRTVQHTRWWPAAGSVHRDFDDVLVNASTRLAPEEVSRLAPWTSEGALPFQQPFLAGYRTLRYDIEPEAGLGRAQEEMGDVISGDVRADIGGDVQQVHDMDTRYRDLHFKLLLLPVWVAGYLYGGKTYTVYINAHTGQVVGERPWSKPKIIAAVLAALLFLALAAWFFVRQQEPAAPTYQPTRLPSASGQPFPSSGTAARTPPVSTGTAVPGPTYWTS